MTHAESPLVPAPSPDAMTTALLQRAGLLSVVIPAFNGEDRLPRAVRSISRFLNRRMPFEILVVDDGSSDGTAEAVSRLQREIPELRSIRLAKNEGKGAAVRAGVLASKGAVVLFTDADQSTGIDQIGRVLEPILDHGFDIAMGSRALSDSDVIVGQSWYRQAFARGFRVLTRTLLVRGFGDCQCGFKCFTRAAADTVFSQLTSTAAIFDMEIMLLAARGHLRVAEVPVDWTHDPDSRLTYNVSRSLGLLRELLRIRRRWRVRVAPRAPVSEFHPGQNQPNAETRHAAIAVPDA